MISVTPAMVSTCIRGTDVAHPSAPTDRFWARVDQPAPDACWNWSGPIATNGYGVCTGGKAHRVAYEALRGPIPEGLHLDHLCRNRACCNPAHLEPVTPKENVLRGHGITALNARKTHCLRGHELTPENTYIRKLGRDCRPCALDRGLERKRRLRAEARSALTVAS